MHIPLCNCSITFAQEHCSTATSTKPSQAKRQERVEVRSLARTPDKGLANNPLISKVLNISQVQRRAPSSLPFRIGGRGWWQPTSWEAGSLGHNMATTFEEFWPEIAGLCLHSCQSRAFRFRALPVASKSWRRFSNRQCHCRTYYCSSAGFGLFRLTEHKPLGTHDLICCHTACGSGLGIDALVIGCTRNTTVIVVWAWMLWLPYALGKRTLLWFGHACSGYRNTTVIMVWAWML